MKTILTIFVLFFSPLVFADTKVFYCIEDQLVGFDSSNNYEFGYYKENRFKIKIDFKKPYFSSEDIFMSITECNYAVGTNKDELYCTTPFGAYFSISNVTYKFARAGIIGIGVGIKDTLFLSHCSCEPF